MYELLAILDFNNVRKRMSVSNKTGVPRLCVEHLNQLPTPFRLIHVKSLYDVEDHGCFEVFIYLGMTLDQCHSNFQSTIVALALRTP